MKRTTQFLAVIILIALFNHSSYAQKQQEWKAYRNVQDAGFSQEHLDEAKITFEQMRSEAFMVIHKGHVLLSWGDPSRRFMAHSIRKSFMSAMYGIYIEKGSLDLNKTLRELDIQDKQSLTETELDATVVHLISARSGIYHPAAYEPRSMQASRPERGSAKPGENFFYNNWDFNTLVTIFNQETGQDFFGAFAQDIANPIGMEDLRMEDMNYRNEPDKSIHPAYLFKISSRDLARFGQLYLNGGKWNGKQIISEDWIKKSTSIQSKPANLEGRDGYGYLWWIDNHSFDEVAYYASGLGGHRMYVFPESEMVIVHRVNTYLMQGGSDGNIVNLIHQIFDAKQGESVKKPKLTSFKFDKQAIPSTAISKEVLSQYVGIYTHPFFGKMEVYLDEEQLKMKGDILGNFRLFPQSENQFVVEDVPELPLEIVITDDEELKGTSLTEVNDQRIPVKFILYNY